MEWSGDSPLSMPARNRWPCGPSYLGPGNRSVTAETGEPGWQMLHLMQRAAGCSTCSTAASGSAGGGGGEEGGDPGGGGQGDPLARAFGGGVVGGEQAADAVDVGQERLAVGADRAELGVGPDPGRGQRVVAQEPRAQVGQAAVEALDGQAGDLLGEGAVAVGLDAVAGAPAGGQHQLLAAGRQHPGGALA